MKSISVLYRVFQIKYGVAKHFVSIFFQILSDTKQVGK